MRLGWRLNLNQYTATIKDVLICYKTELLQKEQISRYPISFLPEKRSTKSLLSYSVSDSQYDGWYTCHIIKQIDANRV